MHRKFLCIIITSFSSFPKLRRPTVGGGGGPLEAKHLGGEPGQLHHNHFRGEAATGVGAREEDRRSFFAY
jgi:hypothetical protein